MGGVGPAACQGFLAEGTFVYLLLGGDGSLPSGVQ